MGEVVTILVLGLIIISQAIERYFYSKQMTNKLSECLRAVMSRNINEFISSTAAEKAPKTEFVQNDSVLMDELSEQEFDKMVGELNKH